MKKRNRKLRKAFVLVCCALALVAISVGATLAYLTDTDKVTNVFTVGKVGISLKETDIDQDGDTQKNAYHLIPGQSYTKDPTVTLDAESESSYIRMLVTVEDYADLLAACENHPNEKDAYGNPYFDDNVVLLQNFTDWTEASKWDFACVTVGDDAKAIYEFRYETAVANTGETPLALDPLFSTITLPGWMNNDDLLSLNDLKITVEAHAIQAAGFKDAEEAWIAFKNQMN